MDFARFVRWSFTGACSAICCGQQPGAVRSLEQVEVRPILLTDVSPDTAACEGHGVRAIAVTFVLSAVGKPTHLQLTQSSGNACVDRSVLRAISKDRFAPAREHGRPVAVQMYMDTEIDWY